jgi:CheY-like chemotaxis protein
VVLTHPEAGQLAGVGDSLAPADQFLDKIDRLMPFRVKKFLLVASLYDCFVLEEDGRLHELLMETYGQWNLGYVPRFVRVSGGEDALNLLRAETFDLVIAVMRLGDMDPFTFGRQVKQIDPELPVIGLAYNTPELQRILEMDDGSAVERIFVWQGDGHILLGIIQFIEDRKNAANDTQVVGVQNILLIEDDIAFYSSYLPLIFSALRKLNETLLKEDLTFSQRLLRQNARPRVHLATTYEEAEAVYARFKASLLGIITDAGVPQHKVLNPTAGIQFLRAVLAEVPHLPMLLQSGEPGVERTARDLGVPFISKKSPTLLRDLTGFLSASFGFGELVLKDPRSATGLRITDVNQLFAATAGLPDEVLAAALARGDLDRWLRARTEFALANAVRELAAQVNPPPGGLGGRLRRLIAESRAASQRGSIVTYSRHFRDDPATFSVMGGGSVGGKARGLAFMDRILARYFDPGQYPGVSVSIPRTVVLGTDVFDDFIEQNYLLPTAVVGHSDTHLANFFLKASLPGRVVGDLRDFIEHVKVPLAVRSSSLLEDSLYQPFAGIYATKMLPNDQTSDDLRFLNLVNAIKFVLASTFFRQAKSYLGNTPHRIEDEKMAVVIQPVVGRRHGDCFYPDFSGVACSYNYYPVGQAKPEDGVANVALGLGKTVVEGGASLRFTPAFPGVLPQFPSVRDLFRFSQREFYAIAMRHAASVAFLEEDQYLVRCGLDRAEADGTLRFLASTYSRDDDALYDGIGRSGPRIVTFAHVLKNDVFPLAGILIELLRLSSAAMNCAVEIEFAGTLDPVHAVPAQFSLLQVRPMVARDGLVHVELDDRQRDGALCFSDRASGNGVWHAIRDIVYVKPAIFEAARNPQIAVELDGLNAGLREAGTPYVLIGPGRWGSTDPWLGIPVKWDQISGVKVVVEASLPGMNVDPSQGSHFFQNMTALGIGYFTVAADRAHGFVDWPWLESQVAAEETDHLRHVRLAEPLTVLIDGRKSRGVVRKPLGASP